MQRPSLLTPGRFAAMLPQREWLWLAGLYVFAVALRWSLRDIQPYTAESVHFVVARGLWNSATNVGSLNPADPLENLSWFFWQRPLLTLPFWPVASLSFEAYRATHILAVAAAPALGVWLLRSLGTTRSFAYAAGVVLALHPALFAWTILFLPDALVLTLMLAALLAAHHGRPLMTAILLLAAGWVKEVAFVSALALLGLALLRDADGTQTWRRPFRLGPFARWLWPVVPLCFLPLWLSLQVSGAVFPGFRPGGDEAAMYESLWGLLYLTPLPFFGLLFERTRRFSLVALAWPAFFLVYHYLLDKAIESWYNVIPASLTILAAAAALGVWWQERPAPRRLAAPAVGIVLLLLLGVQIALPDTHALNSGLVTPFSGRGQWNLDQAIHAEETREQDLAALLSIPGPDERSEWIAYDLDWSLIYYPVGSQAERVAKVYSDLRELDFGVMVWWANAIENRTDVTLVFGHDDRPINVATRAAYADCATTSGHYTLIQPNRGCHNRASLLWERYQAARVT